MWDEQFLAITLGRDDKWVKKYFCKPCEQMQTPSTHHTAPVHSAFNQDDFPFHSMLAQKQQNF